MSGKKAPQKKTAQKSSFPSIKARIDRLVDYEGSNVRAIASVNIGNAFAIHGFKVYESEEKGLSVLNPATKGQKDGKYYENAHPITAEAHTALTNAVLKAYEQHLQEVQEQADGEELGEQIDEDELPFVPAF